MQSIIYPIIQKPIIQSNKGTLTTWLTLMEDTNGDKKSEVSFAKQANWILVSDIYCVWVLPPLGICLIFGYPIPTIYVHVTYVPSI